MIPLGEYFQVQDDFLDCYGAPEVIGKIGTDILVSQVSICDWWRLGTGVEWKLKQASELKRQDNKCSWNINTALAHATPEQRAVLDANYGKKDASAEAQVKQVFSQEPIAIPRRYEEYESGIYTKLNSLIASVEAEGSGLKKEVFESFLAKIYKRSK